MSYLMHFKFAAYVIKFHFHQISIWFFNTLRSCALTWINSAITASLSTCATCDLRCCTTASCDSHILGPTRMKPCRKESSAGHAYQTAWTSHHSSPWCQDKKALEKYILLLRMLLTSEAAREANRQQSCSDPSDAACSFNLGLFLFCSPSVSQLSDLIKPRLPQNSEEE